MKTMFQTLIVAHLDHCSQLWMTVHPTQVKAIEKLQKDFINRIPALRELHYWQQLSLDQRLERYCILYF